MKFSQVLPALASVLSVVTAAKSHATKQSNIANEATFKPAQVFKNTNLVHVISLEKNYVKESINVLIENIAKDAQDEYYLPFTADQMSRVGSIEVKDRKNAEAGTFGVEAVEVGPNSDVQYYRIKLPEPLKASGSQTLGITFYYTQAYTPLPASIAQEDAQFLVYSFSAYCPSVYPTMKQKTEVKLPSSNAPDYTKIPGSGDVKEFPQKQGSKLTYGPFDEKPAGIEAPVQVRFEFTKPVLHVSELERDVEVSHWGGNVAFEERYTMHHRGANLSSLFNRVKWQQAAYYNPNSYALKEMNFPLAAGSLDPYFYDVIGNVSTSRFRSNKREALLAIKPRYPLFGGWKYPFTIGWNSDAKNFVRTLASGGYILNVPFLEGPKMPEGIEYETVVVRVILPEGAENVKYFATVPGSSISEATVGIHKTFLDTIGRTELTIKARNLVDELRDRELIVSYDLPFMASLRKPLVVFGSMMAAFVAAYVIGGVELKFAAKSK